MPVTWTDRIVQRQTDFQKELEKLRRKYEGENPPPEPVDRFGKFESLFPEFREVEKTEKAEVSPSMAFKPYTNPFRKDTTFPTRGAGGEILTPEMFKQPKRPEEDVLAETPQMPKLTWLDKVREIEEDPVKLVPFVSSGVEIYTLSKLLKAAKDLDEFDKKWASFIKADKFIGSEEQFALYQKESREAVSREDLLGLKEYVDLSLRDKDWGYKVADVVAQIIPFAGEFIATGGIFAVGKTATIKASEIALKKLATKTGAKILERKLVQLGVQAAGTVAGGTLRALVTGAVRVPAGTLEKQLQATLVGDEESVFDSAKKAFGEHWVEIVSESTGGMFRYLSGPIKGRLIKMGLFKAFLKANPTRSASDVGRVFNRMGYHGVLGEMLEERIAEIGHGILEPLGLSDQKFRIPSLEQLSVELAAFSVPGVTMKAVEGFNRLMPKGMIPGMAMVKGPEIPEPEEAREPWQMTRAEYDKYVESVQTRQARGISAPGAIGKAPVTKDALKAANELRQFSLGLTHRQQLEQALSEGKPVPPEVLADYPDLKPAEADLLETIRQDINLLREERVMNETMQTKGSRVVNTFGEEGTITEPASELASSKVADRYVEVTYDNGRVMVVDGRSLKPSRLQEDIAEFTQGKIVPEFPQAPSAKPPIEPGVTPETEGVYWHGSPSGELVGGTRGLHIGTQQAAREALEARIGIPAEGTWDGTRVYGETLLAGQNTMKARGDSITGFNVDAPLQDYLPKGGAKFADSSAVSLSSKPDIFPVRIKGEMTNTPQTAYEDFKATGYVSGQIKRGRAKRGAFYINVGEDAGSISAVLPNRQSIERVSKPIAKPSPEPTKPVPSGEAPPPAAEEVVGSEVRPEEAQVREQLGELTKMSNIWSKKLASREQTKASLAKFVRENLPPNVRGRYITAVARIKTDAQLQTQLTKVQDFAEQNSQKVLKVAIRKEVKKARAKVKQHILKGKFTPEVQRRLDVLAHNLELDRDTAREKIAQNITAYQEGKLGYEEMLQDNEMLNFAGIEGMSAEELANTLEYIKIVETIGRSDRQAKQEKATEKIQAIRSDISNILTGGKGLKTGVGAVPRGELVAKTGWWDTFVNWQFGIDNLADKLSKFDVTSKPYQSELSKFVALVHRATFRQVSETKKAFNRIKDIVGEVYGVKGTHDINQVLNSLEEEVNLGVFELTEEYKVNHPDASTVTMKMTRDQMIAKYMQMQDSTLNDAFTTGMGWSQKVRDAVVNNLTAEEKKLADAMFGFYEDYYQGISDIYSEMYNVDMPQNAVYSPRFRDFESDITENVLTLQDAQRFAGVTARSIKARQQSSRPLRFNGSLDLLSKHIQEMEHFKAWATTMRDMRRVFGSKEIRQAVEQYHGQGVLKLVDTFLNQMARGGIETAATNRAADFLRRNFTKSILAIKPVIMLKQIPSLFGYVSEMNVTEFVGGIADFWTNPVTNFKFLYANSEMFRARMEQGFERDIRAAMQKHGKKLISGQGKLTDWFLLQIRLGDTFAVTQGMWAKYKAGLKQGLTQEEAIATAEDTTGRTQPSFGIDTLSAIQNGGSFLKLMTMFQNQPNKYFRMTSDNLRNFKYGRGSRAKAASTILLTWVILPMMFQFIADAFQWKPERQARAGILGPLNFVLIGGQLVQSMWGWLTDQPFDYQISPVAQTGKDLQMIFQKAKKLFEQGQDPYKDISFDDMATLVEYLAKAGGQVTGLPTPYFAQVSKQMRHLKEEGKAVELKHFLFSEWALKPPEKKAEEEIEELNLKLGEVKEGQEDKPLTDKPLKLYDTTDWFRDIGKVYDNVLPQDVLDDPKSSKESKAWAEYEISRQKADILPNKPLYQINTKDNADTIINYYQQWKAREKIESLVELKEFDKLYPKAYLGNVTRQQYRLLMLYLITPDDKKKALRDDHPELKVDPRDEWLKLNPIDNARLALAGKANIMTPAAYKEFKKLIKEFDIPDNAIPEEVLPKLPKPKPIPKRQPTTGKIINPFSTTPPPATGGVKNPFSK